MCAIQEMIALPYLTFGYNNMTQDDTAMHCTIPFYTIHAIHATRIVSTSFMRTHTSQRTNSHKNRENHIQKNDQKSSKMTDFGPFFFVCDQ